MSPRVEWRKFGDPRVESLSILLTSGKTIRIPTVQRGRRSGRYFDYFMSAKVRAQSGSTVDATSLLNRAITTAGAPTTVVGSTSIKQPCTSAAPANGYPAV
jgi:hypothetical protein